MLALPVSGRKGGGENEFLVGTELEPCLCELSLTSVPALLPLNVPP